jgi:hypothetical protein
MDKIYFVLELLYSCLILTGYFINFNKFHNTEKRNINKRFLILFLEHIIKQFIIDTKFPLRSI